MINEDSLQKVVDRWFNHYDFSKAKMEKSYGRAPVPSEAYVRTQKEELFSKMYTLLTGRESLLVDEVMGLRTTGRNSKIIRSKRDNYQKVYR